MPCGRAGPHARFLWEESWYEDGALGGSYGAIAKRPPVESSD